jgi:glycosyltransferase (activator-dependent family)
MRVLLCTVPYKTHFQSMVPLAWALRTAGHEVRVASQPFFAGTITGAGLTAAPVGRNYDGLRPIKAFELENPDGRAAFGMPMPYRSSVMAPETIAWEEMLSGYEDVLVWWHKPLNFPLIHGLVEFARDWQPDLVVWEPVSYAGPLAAMACGAAHARLLWSIDAFGVTREHFRRVAAGRRTDPLGEWLGDYARAYGGEFTEELITGQFSIDPLPGSLRMPAENLHYVPMQYIPYGGSAVVPDWLRKPPRRPRVALTLGVSATEIYEGYSVSVPDILASLSDLDVEVVATVAESHQPRLGRVPDNTRVVSYVPLHALAPTCSAVINHAGPGTFLTVARYGVPQLNVPWDFDEPELARRSAALGGSLVLPVEQATGPAVRAAVQRLLTEPGFLRGAERLRDDMLALPTPNDLVQELEELTTKYRRRP